MCLLFNTLYDKITQLSIHNTYIGDKYMSILDAIILGIVQGVAEFLPISSSGHLAILHNLFNMSDLGSNHMFFDVLLHFGTLIAICFMYWSDIKAMFTQTIDMLSGRPVDENGRRRRFPEARLFMLIIVATLPLVLILPVHKYIEALSNSTVYVGIALILTGCMLLVSDKMAKGSKTEKNMLFTDALIVGLCQCVATLPGLSRSGTTITAGIATGHDRSYAVKFSLLMSIPAVLGATLLELVDAFKAGIDVSLIPAYLFGMIAAMVSGVLSIGLLKMIARKTRFGGKLFFAAPYIRVVERQHFRWTPDLALLRRIDTEFRNMIHGILISDSEISITLSGIHDRFGFESRHLQKLSALRQWNAECDVPFFTVRFCRTKEVNASMTL